MGYGKKAVAIKAAGNDPWIGSKCRPWRISD